MRGSFPKAHAVLLSRTGDGLWAVLYDSFHAYNTLGIVSVLRIASLVPFKGIPLLTASFWSSQLGKPSTVTLASVVMSSSTHLAEHCCLPLAQLRIFVLAEDETAAAKPTCDAGGRDWRASDLE